MVDMWLIYGWYMVDIWLIYCDIWLIYCDIWLIYGWYMVDIWWYMVHWCRGYIITTLNSARKHGIGMVIMVWAGNDSICFYRVDLIQQPANSQFLTGCPPWKRLWNLPLYDYLESGTNRRHGMKCLKSSKQFTLGIGWNWWKHRKTRAPVFVSWIKPIREEKTPRERKHTHTHTPLRKQIATPFLVLWIQDHGPKNCSPKTLPTCR